MTINTVDRIDSPDSDFKQVQSKKDSLNKRYFFKLLANIIGFLIGIVTQMIIPRGLGPKAYGDFNFLTNFFTQIVSFMDMGTSTCFYIKVSGRPKENSLISFYAGFVLIVTLVVLGFVGSAHFSGAYKGIWLDQELIYIYLAAGWGLLTWYIQIFGGITDAYGITVPAEKVRMLQRIVSLGAIALLYAYHQLYLPQFFLYHYFILVLLLGLFIVIILRRVDLTVKGLRLRWQQTKDYVKEFYHYSHPIFIIALVGLVEGIFDRWLLQYYGGSLQQGFYSLSYQIGAICILFTSAMTPLLMREYSILHGTNSIEEMGRLFKRYVPGLYAIAAYFSCFIMVQSADVVKFVGGSAYQGSIAAVAIMSLYPVHQTYGQLTSSLFYATGQTRLYRNISVVFSALSLPFTYVMIAPTEKYGLNFGATGLAVKMVAINIFAVNVQLYFNARLLRLRYLSYLINQALCLGILIVLAYVSSIGARHLLPGQTVAGFLLSGILYTTMFLLLVYLKPESIGVARGDVRYIVKKARNGWNTKIRKRS